MKFLNKELTSGSGFKKYFLNTSWLMAEKLTRMGLGIFVGIYVVRYLGPERFGVLSFSVSFVGIFVSIAALGLDGIVVRSLVELPEKQKEILGTAFVLKLFGALLMWLSILIAIPFTNSDVSTNFLVAIIAFSAIFQSFNVVDYYNQATVRSRYTVQSQMLQMLISSALQIAFVLNAAPLIWFAWVYVVDAAVLAIGLFSHYALQNKKIGYWTWNSGLAKRLLKDSWWLMFSGVVVSIYMKIDQIMIKEMLGVQKVGYYAAAVKLSEAWYFIPMAISSSVFPAILGAKKSNFELYCRRMNWLYFLLFWQAFMVAIPVTLMSPWVIEFLYGKEFLESASVLSIHIWAGLFVALGVASSSWLLSENLQKISLYRTALGAIINLGLNVLFIPLYGIEGAALATLISYALATFSLFFFKQTRHHSLFMLKAILKAN